MSSDTTNRPPVPRKRKRLLQPNRRLANPERIPTGMRWRISTGLNPLTVGRAAVKTEDAISGVGHHKVVVVAAVINRADLDAILAAAHPNVLADQLRHGLPAHRPPVPIDLRPRPRQRPPSHQMHLVRVWTRRCALRLLQNLFPTSNAVTTVLDSLPTNPLPWPRKHPLHPLALPPQNEARFPAPATKVIPVAAAVAEADVVVVAKGVRLLPTRDRGRLRSLRLLKLNRRPTTNWMTALMRRTSRWPHRHPSALRTISQESDDLRAVADTVAETMFHAAIRWSPPVPSKVKSIPTTN